MTARILGMPLLTAGLLFSLMGAASATTPNAVGKGNGNHANAPELDPSDLGGSVIILAGFLLLNDHRRKLTACDKDQ